MKSMSAHEAKTHLPQLFERVALGEEIQITRDERPVGRLVPDVASLPEDNHAVIAQIKGYHKGRPLGEGARIRDLIAEGRRL